MDYISQYITDIRHVSGEDNVVADALSRINEIMDGFDADTLPRIDEVEDSVVVDAPSRVEEVTITLNFQSLAASQRDDLELKDIYNHRQTGFQLQIIRIPGTDAKVFQDTSMVSPKPFLNKPF